MVAQFFREGSWVLHHEVWKERRPHDEIQGDTDEVLSWASACNSGVKHSGHNPKDQIVCYYFPSFSIQSHFLVGPDLVGKDGETNSNPWAQFYYALLEIPPPVECEFSIKRRAYICKPSTSPWYIRFKPKNSKDIE